VGSQLVGKRTGKAWGLAESWQKANHEANRVYECSGDGVLTTGGPTREAKRHCGAATEIDVGRIGGGGAPAGEQQQQRPQSSRKQICVCSVTPACSILTPLEILQRPA
jgi:hypothetical protein